MSKNDYIQLVKSSEVFMLLDEKMQQSILDADGEIMMAYLQIFSSAAAIEQENKAKFIQETQVLYDKFLHDVQEKDKKIRVVLEEANQIEEEMESQLLLDEVENEI